MKENADRFPFYVAVFYIVACSIVSVCEWNYHAGDLHALYFGVKVGTIIVAFPFAILFYKGKRNDLLTVLFFINMFIYSAWCALFFPLYELSFFEIAIATAFFTTRRKWIYLATHIFGAIMLSAAILLRKEIGFYQNALTEGDYVVAIVIILGLGYLTHSFYHRERDFRNEALLRFSVMGRQTIQVAHDIKGLLSAPTLYIDSIKSKNEIQKNKEIYQTLNLLAEDLEKMRSVILMLNKMVSTKQDEQLLSLHRSAQKVSFLLQSRLKGIEVQLHHDAQIKGAQYRLESILFNLFLNSIEAFQRTKPQRPYISIRYEFERVIFSDNAGGVSDSVFESLLRGDSISTKHDSIGMGLTLVRNDLHHFNLKIDFEKSHDGLSIVLYGPNISAATSM